eukprot:11223573-Lingulodinium_polyedra.AAC.1
MSALARFALASAAELLSCEKRDSGARWKEWCEAALEGSAKRAHAFTRLPVAPVEEPVSREEGFTAALPGVLEAQAEQWCRVWRGTLSEPARE